MILRKFKGLFFLALSILHFVAIGQEKRFNLEKDLLMVQFDNKTDIDDLHTAAALATLVNHPDYQTLNYFPVAGTYGIQEGLYVPPNELMTLAFNNKWADAHESRDKAIKKVIPKIRKVVRNGGAIWVADAGQSDFTALWVKKLLELEPELNTKEKIHVVQHSDWNEEVTSAELLNYVKEKTDYHKIPDGNAVGNGTPGFRAPEPVQWREDITNGKLMAIWETAIRLGNQYNGKENRYLNEAVASGGLDFSDLSEVCYILNREEIKDAEAFFDYFSQNASVKN